MWTCYEQLYLLDIVKAIKQRLCQEKNQFIKSRNFSPSLFLDIYKRMDMLDYRNFQNIVENKTSCIRFETIDKLSRILDVPFGDLFERIEDETNE